MKAVHFGAGNIGRGFIGTLLFNSGYEVVFVDVNETVIQAINNEKKYDVIFAANDYKKQTVKNIRGINSMTHPSDVIEAIVEADLVTTAIGPTILPKIAKLLTQGLQERHKYSDESLPIIACENMVGGSSFLKENIYTYLSDEEVQQFENKYLFLNTAVDRIIPNQNNENVLDVSVEPYFEWIVENNKHMRKKPLVKGIHFVEDLSPYIERKLFTVNTGHAVVAFYGHYLGFKTIAEAIEDNRVSRLVNGVLQETGEAIIQKYGFKPTEHKAYIDTILQRFQNPFISDEVTRVARGAIRKLHKKDRFVQPALIYMEKTAKDPINLATIIAIVLQYKHSSDEEAVKLQQMINELGYEKTLQQVTELESGHPLIALVLQQVEKLKENLSE